MRVRYLVLILASLLFAPSLFARARYNGICEQGNYSVTVPGASGPSTNKFQRSFPSCTVTVYLTGTLTLATIYSDDSGTSQANPFTAATTGMFFFYANNGVYDVKLSGSGISSPFTIGAVTLLDYHGPFTGTTFGSVTNCADSAGAAACGSAPAGHVVIDAATTSTVVSTTAVTAASEVLIQRDNSLGTLLSVTCNTQSTLVLGTPVVSARTASTSFTIAVDVAPTTNPMCLSYFIVN